QLLHGRDEVLADGTADAAVTELDHILFTAGVVAAAEQHFAVDAELAELVDDERNALALRVRQQMPDERGLAGAEKAGDDGDGDAVGHGMPAVKEERAPVAGRAGNVRRPAARRRAAA